RATPERGDRVGRLLLCAHGLGLSWGYGDPMVLRSRRCIGSLKGTATSIRGPCLQVARGRSSNGVERAIVVRVWTPAFSLGRRIRYSRSPVVRDRNLRM